MNLEILDGFKSLLRFAYTLFNSEQISFACNLNAGLFGLFVCNIADRSIDNAVDANFTGITKITEF